MAIGTDDHLIVEPDSPRATWLISQLTISALCFSLLTLAALIYLRRPLAPLGDWGYSGLVLVAIVLAVVATTGGLSGYILGARRGQAFQGRRTYSRFLVPVKRWTGPSLFAFAILPGPFMMATLWAGTIHYPLWRFMLFVTAGKAIKLTGFAFAGYHSLPWLLKPLG